MAKPDEARRCWTLNYADGAHFHMDVLPALQDGERQRMLIEATGHPNEWAEMSVAITDIEHPNYRVRCDDWPASNPKGYAEWFRSRMRAIFEARVADRALQRSTAEVLSAIYEQDFLPCSFGGRPGLSPHHALATLY
jgi:hypothetical protein